MWKQARRSPVSSEQVVDRAAAANHVEDVGDDRRPGVAGSRGDRPGARDVLDAVDETEELHRGQHAECLPNLEQLGEPAAGAVQVHDFLGRAGDDVRASQLDGLGHPAPAVVQHARMLGPSAVIQPCSAITLTTLRPASARARFRLGAVPALLEIGGDLVVPGLDRLVSGLAGDLDLLQQRRRPDRAGVETVEKLAHRDRSGLQRGPSLLLCRALRLERLGRTVRALRCVVHTAAGCARADGPSRRRRRCGGRHRDKGSRR